MFEFPFFEFPQDKWIEAFIDWLTVGWRFEFFRAISDVVLWGLVRIERFLLWLPPGIFILILAFLAWRLGKGSKTRKELAIVLGEAVPVAIGLTLLTIAQATKVTVGPGWVTPLFALVTLAVLGAAAYWFFRRGRPGLAEYVILGELGLVGIGLTLLTYWRIQVVILSPWATIAYVLLVLPAVIAGAFWIFAGRRPGLTELAIGGMIYIGALALWLPAMRTLAVVGIATLISVGIAIPIGILMAKSDWVQAVVRPTLDAAQTMPSFVYLVPALMLFGLGKVPAVIATVIYAVPPGIRLTNLGIRLVAKELLEAAEAFGTTPRQMLLKVQLPVALPTIMAGVNQVIMASLAMVVIASLVGAAGLGVEVLHGIARLRPGQGFNGGIGIVVLAVIIDRVTQNLGKGRRGQEQTQ
ncbi:MAG: ABC transporter permease [Anaerolineales bacterium]